MCSKGYNMLKRNVDDTRRVDEIDDTYAKKKAKKFTSIPDKKQLKDGEMCIVTVDGTRSVVFRDGDKLYKADLAEV